MSYEEFPPEPVPAGTFAPLVGGVVPNADLPAPPIPPNTYVPLVNNQVPAALLPYPVVNPATIVPLVNGVVPSQYLTGVAEVANKNMAIYGQLTALAGSVVSYSIMDYINTATYEVSAALGTVSLAGRTITYTAPATAGTDTITVNGTAIPIEITTDTNVPILIGPSAVVAGITASYVIGNYSASNAYSAASTYGSTTLAGNIVEYATSPSNTGAINLTVIATIAGVQHTAIASVNSINPTDPIITGPKFAIVAGSSVNYVIENYMANAAYSVAPISGTVSISGNTITYTPPATQGEGGFSVNGIDYSVGMIYDNINTPSILSPVNTGFVSSSTTVMSSAFSSVASMLTQVAANWELATDPGFTNIVQSSMNDKVNLNSWPLTGLSKNTTYYVRVQYIGTENIVSAWSSSALFSTSAFVPTTIIAELVDNNPGANDTFGGWSTSTNESGSILVVGAPGKNIGTNASQGAAYVFAQVNGVWVQQAELLASNGAANDNFGFRVAMNSVGNTVIISAYNKTIGANSGQGAAYIFTETNGVWTQQAELTAADGAAGDNFSFYVAIDSLGITTAISALTKTINGNGGQGAVYVFTLSNGTWIQQAELTATNGASGDRLGTEIYLTADGTGLIASAYLKTIGANANQGAAYIFNKSGGVWSQTAELTASDGAANDYFGWSTSINANGTIAIVGAGNKTNGANANQGAAYVFIQVNGVWTQQAKLLANDGAANDIFGGACAINSVGDIVAVGAPQKTIGANANQGAAYIFIEVNGTWLQQTRLTAPDGASGDTFGASPSLNASGSILFTASPNKKISGLTASGAVYVAI